MPTYRRLRAKIEALAEDNYCASYRVVAGRNPATARGREVTTHYCSSEDAARQWLQDQAADLGLEYIEAPLAAIRGMG